MMTVLFWLCTAGLFYIYLGYPLLAWAAAVLRGRRVVRRAGEIDCSVIIVACDEAGRIGGKVRSLARCSRPEVVREVLIASDGSRDATVDEARSAIRGLLEAGTPGERAVAGRMRVLEFPVQRGKPAVLNDVSRECRGEVLVFSDARQEIHPDAIPLLLENFADPAVGAVSGELVFRSRKETAVVEGTGFYWNYEKWIRRNESRWYSVPGATGALYAVRRGLFRPIPPETVLDDVVIPMEVVLSGRRCVFDERAVVYDEPEASEAAELRRKRRTIGGNVQLVRLFPGWLLPWRNPIWVQFVSHKLLRLGSPFFLLGLFFASFMLHARIFYATCFVGQVVLYGCALAGWIFQRMGVRGRGCGVALMFVGLNGIILAALWDALRGKIEVKWRRA